MGDRTAGRGRTFLACAVAAGVSGGVLWVGLRLDVADFNAPFDSSGDALHGQPMVKSVVETGTHWRTERQGAPGVQELYDFPVVDHLHFALVWALGRAVGWVAAYNLYHLLTYPLAAVGGAFVLRRLGLSAAAAACGGVLFAFQPYHYLRGFPHYFLSAYWMVPLSLLPAVRVCQGRLPFFRPAEGGGWRFAPLTADTLGAVLIALATASAGVYYAFFGCGLLCAAGVYGWVAAGTWRAAAAAAGVVAVVVAGGVLNSVPVFLYQMENGHNSTAHRRSSEEADEYGLKLAHLVLPTYDHNLPPLAAARAAFHSPTRPTENENDNATLGAVGTVGLVVLLAAALLRPRRLAPLAPAAALAAFAFLLGTLGGLGTVIATVYPQVRAYNRVSIFLAFFALYASCWVLDRACDRWAKWARWPAALALLAFGVWDQTGTRWFSEYPVLVRRAWAEQFYADRDFFRRVEQADPGGAVFCLPFLEYPEPLPPAGYRRQYDPARGFLHTDTLRWSYGAMKGREVDQWQREVSAEPPAELLRRATARGFTALYIDRRGYADAAEADAAVAALLAAAGPDAPRIDHADGQSLVLDLRPYLARQRAERGADAVAADARRESDAVRVVWLDGFWVGGGGRWCGSRGELMFINPADRPQTVSVEFTLATDHDEPTRVEVAGGAVWSETLEVGRRSGPLARSFVVPPGRHRVRVHCRPPPVVPLVEHYRLVWVDGFKPRTADAGR